MTWFYKYFSISCQIRKDTNLGWPYLESPQKSTPDDTHIVHFGPGPNMPVAHRDVPGTCYLGYPKNIPDDPLTPL